MKQQTTTLSPKMEQAHKKIQQPIESDYNLSRTREHVVFPQYEIENGLLFRARQCHEFTCDSISNILNNSDSTYTLAFFPDNVDLSVHSDDRVWNKNAFWNILFAAPLNTRLQLSTATNCRFVSIHFSHDWFCGHLSRNLDPFNSEERKTDEADVDLLLDSMSAEESELVVELLKNTWRKTMGGFYIKSLVLQLISDVVKRVTARNSALNSTTVQADSLSELEHILINSINSPRLNIKQLADRLSLSESSLKRYFKQRHGENISSFFQRKKMEYADFLIKQKKQGVPAAARATGYKSIYSFLSKYKNYCKE